jgi:hypothetical protein
MPRVLEGRPHPDTLCASLDQVAQLVALVTGHRTGRQPPPLHKARASGGVPPLRLLLGFRDHGKLRGSHSHAGADPVLELGRERVSMRGWCSCALVLAAPSSLDRCSALRSQGHGLPLALLRLGQKADHKVGLRSVHAKVTPPCPSSGICRRPVSKHAFGVLPRSSSGALGLCHVSGKG